MTERLKRMKETLASCVEGQLGNLQNVDAKELGEVVDMVKDLEEAIYYCTITKSMEEAEQKEKHTEHHYYTPMYYRDMDRYDRGRMYYPMMEEPKRHDNWPYIPDGKDDATYQPREKEMPIDWRDEREGRSHMSRKMYMESKEMHKDKATKLKDLEHYMKELSEDVVDMIKDASPEEKQLLEKKISALATKVGSLNTSA